MWGRPSLHGMSVNRTLKVHFNIHTLNKTTNLSHHHYRHNIKIIVYYYYSTDVAKEYTL